MPMPRRLIWQSSSGWWEQQSKPDNPSVVLSQPTISEDTPDPTEPEAVTREIPLARPYRLRRPYAPGAPMPPEQGDIGLR